MDTTLNELTQKIDALTAQVAYLTEQAQVAERQRTERAELMHDLTPIVNQAFDLSVAQLEEVQEYVDLSDLLRLVKRLMRNGRNFELMLDRLESFMDLAETIPPITDQAMSRAIEMLAQMEQKGYFVFAQGGLKIADNIVTSFSEEDVQALGDNIVLILQTIKSMTQPEIMSFVRNTVNIVDQEKDAEVDISYRSLMRSIRDPNVRRGLALTMRVLGTIGAQTTESPLRANKQ
ncbi:MAG TPA: hypothetical protein P5121_16445 [Caldilineaceae bacterium]|nr:hypothetical protein [Caldilineaceae bacterium]